jgi:hypothetical protein
MLSLQASYLFCDVVAVAVVDDPAYASWNNNTYNFKLTFMIMFRIVSYRIVCVALLCFALLCFINKCKLMQHKMMCSTVADNHLSYCRCFRISEVFRFLLPRKEVHLLFLCVTLCEKIRRFFAFWHNNYRTS